jgi:hypothetical protein
VALSGETASFDEDLTIPFVRASGLFDMTAVQVVGFGSFAIQSLDELFEAPFGVAASFSQHVRPARTCAIRLPSCRP